MERVLLCEEYRLIERSESEIHGAWKGAHLLFFFLAFVFGSFCTFCFHMMMYLFDEKCVLFPKFLSHASLRHSVMYDFFPDKESHESNYETVPVDFLSAQWVEKSACYLPTYVPLVSGIFGLVWTTMFLMCSTGSRTLTGLQRPWRVLPIVIVFSVAMSSVCIYSSAITHSGLDELCRKLGEITGTSTCTYTINVATLVYNRRIHGVYQATRLTIVSAWLHTACWVLSALLAITRILLVIDFQLVRISAHLRGDFDKMLERHERQLRTVSPDINLWKNYETPYRTSPELSPSTSQRFMDLDEDDTYLKMTPSELLYFATEQPKPSELSLVIEERNKLARIRAYQSVVSDYKFIVKMLYDLMETIDFPYSESSSPSTLTYTDSDSARLPIVRQFGIEQIASKSHDVITEVDKSQETGKREVEEPSLREKSSLHELRPSEFEPSTSKKARHTAFESSMNITSEMKRTLKQKQAASTPGTSKQMKSSLKHIGVQTTKKKKKKRDDMQKVKISDAKHVYTIDDKVEDKTDEKESTSETSEESNKETAYDTNEEAESNKNMNNDIHKVNKEMDEKSDEKTDTPRTQKKEKQD